MTPEPQYTVLDGANRYGPAPVAMLNQWATEGRLRPDMRFEEEGSGRILFAYQVPGLTIAGTGVPGPTQQMGPYIGGEGTPVNSPYTNPPTSNYFRQGGIGPVPPYLTKLGNVALIKAIISCVCSCLPLGIVAVVFAVQGRTKVDQGMFGEGEGQLKTANLLGNIGIGLAIAVWVGYAVLLIIGVASGGLR